MVVNEEVISKIIDKVTNSIPNFTNVQQIESCREYLDLAKPMLPKGTYDELCELLLKRTHEMETELETFIWKTLNTMAKTKKTVTITIMQNGEKVQAQVTGTHYPYRPSTGYYTPPEDAEFDIDAVVVNGIDITKELEAQGYDFTDIEYRCLNAM